MSDATNAHSRAEMPKGTAPILENRTVEKDYRTLLPLLQPGLRVLDVGCGTGTMTADMARIVGSEGVVHGLDNSEHLISRGQQLYSDIPNLELISGDIYSYETELAYDLVTAARVLQWLKEPQSVVKVLMSFIGTGGILSVLDYDHTGIEFKPDPPDSMLHFYDKFLAWRSDAGMNNSIANDLSQYFEEAGLNNVEVHMAHQAYHKGQKDFLFKVGIWSDVASSRGKQLVKDGYLDEASRKLAIEEYSEWVRNDARSMVMKLNEVRGVKTNKVLD